MVVRRSTQRVGPSAPIRSASWGSAGAAGSSQKRTSDARTSMPLTRPIQDSATTTFDLRDLPGSGISSNSDDPIYGGQGDDRPES